jgi:hypothetical protein
MKAHKCRTCDYLTRSRQTICQKCKKKKDEKATTKKCSKCGRVRKLKFFRKDSRYSQGVSGWCKDCFADYNRTPERKRAHKERDERYKLNPNYIEKEKERSLKKYHRDPRKQKDRILRKKFGISLKRFERTKRCILCKRKVRLVADHDHKTNKFRGAICHRCNLGLGWFESISNILKKLKKYLKRG